MWVRSRSRDAATGPFFTEAVGLDPDPGMLEEGARRAADAGVGNITWVRARAEDLPAGLGRFRVATFAQSFHWMDRDRVAALVLEMLEPGGALVHISDFKGDEARECSNKLSHPLPPYEAIRELIRRYLGPVPRAGQGLPRYGSPDGEAIVLRNAGFQRSDRVLIPAGGVQVRDVDDLVAWVYSLSGSAPHQFGDRLEEFEVDLRHLLHDATPSGLFAEQPSGTEVFILAKASVSHGSHLPLAVLADLSGLRWNEGVAARPRLRSSRSLPRRVVAIAVD